MFQLDVPSLLGNGASKGGAIVTVQMPSAAQSKSRLRTALGSFPKCATSTTG